MAKIPVTARPKQITSSLFMVRPQSFGFNAETAESNAFMQQDHSQTSQEIRELAIAEFDAFVQLLREAKIEITVFEDQAVPPTPDAVFPNNWISTHQNGKLFLYPVLAQSRRLERRQDIVDHIQQHSGPYELIDLSPWEEKGQFLESTGSMIMDRINQRVYACISPRTNAELMQHFCEKADCEAVLFYAHDQDGQEIYHTNVMMALGLGFAVICLDSISDLVERQNVIDKLDESGHKIIEITMDQVNAFAGNMLQVENIEGERYLVMSSRAHQSLRPDQLQKLAHYSNILVGPLDVIETYGGGSVRCMMAEIFPTTI
ncbi:MAG: citrulline utilization hydrolase CtlX [Bacteroidia bacterium]